MIIYFVYAISYIIGRVARAFVEPITFNFIVNAIDKKNNE